MIGRKILETRGGVHLGVRAASAEDEAILDEFFQHVSPEDLRFRFLSGMPRVPHEHIVAMTHIDHRQTENFLAFDESTGSLVATAMLACDAALERCEVAIVERADFKGRGIGWELLRHVAEVARERGIGVIELVEDRSNHAAIELQREMGFSVEACPGDATLVLVRKILRPVQSAPAS